MAVTYCTRTDKKTGDENDKSRKLKDEYIVIVDSTDDEPSTILTSNFPGVPKKGDPHPTDALVRVKNVAVRPTENRLYYFLDVTYSNEADNNDGGGGGGGGSVEVLKVTIGAWWEDYIEDYALDENGQKVVRIQNTFGDPIKYEARRPHPMITISAITNNPRFDVYLKKQGMVNQQPVRWLTFDFNQDQLLFDEYKATSIGKNNWQEDFVFKAKQIINPNGYDFPDRPAGWQPFLLNAGLWQWVDENGERRPSPIYPIDKEGNKKGTNPVTEPWPLYRDGTAIPRDLFENDVVYLEFVTFQRTDFGIFNFDFTQILTDEAEKRLL